MSDTLGRPSTGDRRVARRRGPETINAIIDAHSGDTNHDWTWWVNHYKHLHASAQLSGIRRQAHDQDRDSISLRRVVEETLGRYLHAHATSLPKLGDWTDWSERRSRLIDGAGPALVYTNKRIAHRGKKKPDPVTPGEVDDAVDVVIKVYSEVSMVFLNLDPSLQSFDPGPGWQTVFDRPIWPT